MKIHYQFSSQQMGEYFGYALVAEDFNGDTFMDLAIAAPFHKRGSDSYDNGVVYIYQNLEGKSIELYAILSSEYELNGGRFGTTISKIGDINEDGFNGKMLQSRLGTNIAIIILYYSFRFSYWSTL